MSFAGPTDRNVASVLADISKTGAVTFIAAAGNEGPLAAPAFPGNDPHVIAVSGTDPEDNLFMASNRGKHIAVAAPGVGIYMPAPGGTYQMKDGTSFSAALVSGTVALMLQLQPNLDPASAKRILMATARDLGPPGFDEMFGAGLVDAYAAIMSLQPAMVDNGVKFIPASVPR